VLSLGPIDVLYEILQREHIALAKSALIFSIVLAAVDLIHCPNRIRIINKKSGLQIRIHLIRIRIQHFRLNTDPDPDPDPIRIQRFDDQKLKKIYR
jgi:hypothetical protein